MNRIMSHEIRQKSPKLNRFGILLAAVVLSYILAVIIFIVVY
jgi:hypothetical protein